VILSARVDGPSDARPLVLLDAVGSSTEMWTPVLGPLAEQFRVIRLDHRGHGESDPSPARSGTGIGDLAADVLETLDRFGLRRVDLAGLSLGGMVGMWLAAHRPERIGRLALLCTAARMDPQIWTERAAAVRAHGMTPLVVPAVERWLTPDHAARDEALVRSLRAMYAGVDVESYAQCCDAIATMDLRPDLARIAAPTLVIAGAEDLPTPVPDAEAIADGIAGARLVVLDGAAHLATVEDPGRIAALLLDHFRGGATLASGFATRRAVLGDAHVDAAVAATTDLTAPFQEFITRYAWGDVWTRPGLSRRDRSIATLTALTALGAEHELAMHVRAALRNGLSAEEIAEVLLHAAVYAGVPRANRALAVARDVLGENPPS